jgi:hypothetical protein
MSSPCGQKHGTSDSVIRRGGGICQRAGDKGGEGGNFSAQPKNLTQVQNKKKKETLREKRNNATYQEINRVATFSHQVRCLQTLVTLTLGDPLVGKFEQEDSSVPVLVLFTDEQIQDVRQFCCSGQGFKNTILGVDKTYNLGQVYVTVTAFKQLALQRPDGSHPLFFGPMLIHGSSNKATFEKIFFALRSRLYEKNIASEPTFGSDAEAALRAAMKVAFPESRTY